MKKLLALICCLITIPFAMGADQCGDWISASTDCEITTPVTDCTTYDLYNSTHQLATNDGAMTQIGTTGVYYFTFNQADSGSHLVLLCDNSTRTINVGLDKVNATDIPDVTINNTAVAVAVWNDSIVDDSARTVNATAIAGSVSVNSTAIAQAVWEFDISGYSGASWINRAGWFLYWILTTLG